MRSAQIVRPTKLTKKSGAPKRAAPSAEAAPTQKQVLKGKPPAKRKLRDTGVDAAQ